MSKLKILGKNIDIKESYNNSQVFDDCSLNFSLERKLTCSYNDSFNYDSTPIHIIQSKPYLEWCGTAEFRVYTALKSSIIRDKMRCNLTKHIYHEMYEKGMLVSRYSTINLALKLGKPEHYQSHISKYLKSLQQKKFINKIAVEWFGNRFYVYELGYYDTVKRDGYIKKQEVFYMWMEMNEIIGRNLLEKNFSA